MTLRVVFRPEARTELLEAHRWYDDHLVGLGAEFATTVEAAIGAIRRHPHAFRQVLSEYYQCVLRRFPYSLIYRPSGAEIVVIAVHHHRREPGSWRERTA